MSDQKKFKVQVKSDHLEKLTSSSPESALAEMIWNAIDADAKRVEITYKESDLGLIEEIKISDDGTGIPYEEAEHLFSSLGGSWKLTKLKTEQGRFLHGRDGKGRFKAFKLGQRVHWDVTYHTSTETRSYTISGRKQSLDEFTITAEKPVKDTGHGVTVRIQDLESQFAILDKNKAIESLLPLLALHLSRYPQIEVFIDGEKIDHEKMIMNRTNYSLDDATIDKSMTVELEIIEWNDSFSSKTRPQRELWFCDAKGFPLEKYQRQIRGTGEFGFTAYLKSEFLEVQHSHGLLVLSEMEPTLSVITDIALKLIKDHFRGRLLESNRDQLEEWKAENVYPYEGDPQSTVEEAERQVFDIVALNLNHNLADFGKADATTKKFQFRMLRQAVERSPGELQAILNEVLNLPKDKQDELAELLKDVSLVGIISASKLVSDRLKFLTGLEQILFDDGYKKHLKERSQLHRIVAQNTWLFGPEFTLSVDDESLTAVLRKHAKQQGLDVIVDHPVKRLDDTTGIVDLMLSRSIPRNHSDELEHLIVELKAPKIKVGSPEIQQIESYAFAVAKDERFGGQKTRWHFWVMSNSVNDYAEMKRTQVNYDYGIIHKSTSPDMVIWVKTWSQILQENKHRLQFVKQKLDYNIRAEDGLAYLKKTYAEYTKGLNPPPPASEETQNEGD